MNKWIVDMEHKYNGLRISIRGIEADNADEAQYTAHACNLI